MHRTAFALALLLWIGLACGIRQDEFLCENAVSHLQSCCQGYTASNIGCTYDGHGQGCNPATYPEFNVEQSNCILAESCANLVSSGVCSRATALPPSEANSSCTCGLVTCNCPPQGAQVCP